jgi:HEAT repeat protein
LRARTHGLLLVVTIILLAPVVTARARQARIEDVEQSLIHDPSYRVRVGAALVLGRLGKPRSVPVLIRALSDPNPTVRASAATSLGQIGDPAARDPLVRAQQDPNPMVRRMAEKALHQLPEPNRRAPPPATEGRRARPAFEVKPMGDRSHRAGPALRQHMREVLAAELAPVGDVAGRAADPERGYIIDGVIKNLSFAMHPDRVEVTCSVQLVISRQPTGGVFLLTSGEAVVQKPRRHFRTQNRPGMEVEALEGAVRGASEDLRRHLAQQ